MRTYQNLLAALSLSLCAAACGPSIPMFTIQGQTLALAETNYSVWCDGDANSCATPSYCSTLTNQGQYEVMLSDTAICSQVTGQMPSDQLNETVFHSSAETNLRLVFPTFLMKNSDGSFKVNTFAVATNDCSTANTNGAPAVAYFSHNSAGSRTYDINVQADKGSISVTAVDTGTLTGTFDLTFAGEHISGNYSAILCAALTPAYGFK